MPLITIINLSNAPPSSTPPHTSPPEATAATAVSSLSPHLLTFSLFANCAAASASEPKPPCSCSFVTAPSSFSNRRAPLFFFHFFSLV
ncbi:hypothetical protein PIB30_095827 [Stylosanthes scabra]|uniref:Uncharacterized protein n=1 Tax=Stylosanthes scabra TaxID=79078 RepID=A0ABU6UUL6_9FABA|nr:hypothetical protein [Stylosanthes scabra]